MSAELEEKKDNWLKKKAKAWYKNWQEMPTTEKGLVIFFIFIIGVGAAGLFAYMDTFFVGPWWSFGSKNEFGMFGDFMGGILNPLFAFFTVVLLVYSIELQRKELSKSTAALEASQKAHEEQAKVSNTALQSPQNAHREILELSLKESTRKQLEDQANHHLNNIQNLMEIKTFSLTLSNGSKTKVSLQDLYQNSELSEERQLPETVNLIAKFPEYLKLNTAESVHLLHLKKEALLVVGITVDLIPYLALESLRFSWRQKTRDVICQLAAISILTQSEEKKYSKKISTAIKN